MPTRSWQPLIILALGLAVGTTAMVVGQLSPAWQHAELALYDSRLAWLQPRPNPTLALVPLSEAQSRDRRGLAELITTLDHRGAKVIGLDAPLDTPATPDTDGVLSAALMQARAVVLASHLSETPPLRILHALFPGSEGLSLPLRDADGRIRRTTLLSPVTNGAGQLVLRPTYLMELLRRHQADLATRRQQELGRDFWGFQTPRTGWQTLAPDQVANADLTGKTVLVGPAEALSWQAPALQALLEGGTVKPVGRTTNFTVCLLAAVLAGLTFWTGRTLTGILGAAALASALAVGTTLLLPLGYWLYLLPPLAASTGTGLAGAALGSVALIRHRQRVARFFKPYVSPQTVQRLLRQGEVLPDLKSERRVVTVLFSDIAGFTSIAERLPTEEVVQLLNEYLTAMTQIVFANHGTLDKYIGDEVMAVFGNIGPNNPPDDAYRAVKSAIEMQRELGHLQEKWLAEGIVPLQIRIGVNSGEALVGNIGSPQQMDFTVIGDMVNTAKRLEGLNKAYNTNILISQATFSYVKEHVETRFLGPAPIKGRHEPVPVYALLGWQAGKQPS